MKLQQALDQLEVATIRLQLFAVAARVQDLLHSASEHRYIVEVRSAQLYRSVSILLPLPRLSLSFVADDFWHVFENLVEGLSEASLTLQLGASKLDLQRLEKGDVPFKWPTSERALALVVYFANMPEIYFWRQFLLHGLFDVCPLLLSRHVLENGNHTTSMGMHGIFLLVARPGF